MKVILADKIASVAKVSKWEAEDESLLDEDGNLITQNQSVESDINTEEDTNNDLENLDDNLNIQTNEED